MDARLSLQLLGVPRVVLGAEVALPTRKALALLAYLGLNDRVPRRTLAALLWSDRADDGARRNLRQELHRLNALPVGAWIEANGDLLALRPGALVDVRELYAALAARELARAAALARGPLLEGFELGGAAGFMEWLAAQREALARARRGAVQAWAREREAAGDAAAALAALRELLVEDPLDEALAREVMRLSALTGDPAAATALYDRLHARLAAELNVVPQAETVQLARRIRSTPAPREQMSPELRAPLIGRDDAWARLSAAASRLTLIEGESGVGKTRLALEFAQAHGACLVLKGREISRDTPFYPVAEALWQAYREDTGWFERLDPAWRREVARLLPALADEELRDDLHFNEARGRFLEGLTHALLTICAGGSLLADDLQWFDAGSAELLAHLARRAHRVRLIATARSGELEGNAAAGAALEALARDGMLERVPLAPLTEGEVLLLVRALSGASGAMVFARRLHAATAGNPLFILESLRDLFAAGVLWREHGTWATHYDEETEDYRELPLSASVREAVLRRIDRLGNPVRRLLEAASLAGDRFDADALAAPAGLTEWQAVDAVERACAARLIVAAASGYRFAHDLIRRALDDALSPERRRLLHRKLAEALIAAAADPAAIAAHFEGGGRASEAVAWRIRAAEAAARVYSLREAAAQYERALAGATDARTAFRLQSARVEHLRNLADRAGWAAALEAMEALEAQVGDPAASVETAVKRAVYYFDTGRHAEALAVAEQARARLRGRIDEQAEAQLLLEMGAALKALGRIDEAEQHLHVAVERFRNRWPLKHANCAFWLCVCALERGALEAAEHWSQIAVEGSAAAGHRRGHAMSLWTRADIAHRRGQHASAIATMELALAEAREIGSLWLQRELREGLISYLREAGRADEAGRLQRELDASAGNP